MPPTTYITASSLSLPATAEDVPRRRNVDVRFYVGLAVGVDVGLGVGVGVAVGVAVGTGVGVAGSGVNDVPTGEISPTPTMMPRTRLLSVGEDEVTVKPDDDIALMSTVLFGSLTFWISTIGSKPQVPNAVNEPFTISPTNAIHASKPADPVATGISCRPQ
jgi:hypothetical protein